METKKINVTYQFSGIGTITVDVPKDCSFEQALEHVKANLEDYPLPTNWEYLSGSSILDEENCDFEEEE